MQNIKYNTIKNKCDARTEILQNSYNNLTLSAEEQVY